MGSICCPTCARAIALSSAPARRSRGRGTGYVFTIEAAEEEALRPLFDRREQYDALLQICRRCRGRYPTTNWRLRLKQLRKIQRDYRRIEAIDFFPGAAREQAAERLATIEQVINQRLSPNEPQSVAGELSLLDRGAFRGRLWATRRRPWVDRLASLAIRRFIDDEARFLWLAAPETVRRQRSVLILTGRRSATSARVDDLRSSGPALCSGGRDPRRSGAADPLPGRRWGTDPGGGGVESILAGLRETITDDDQLLAAACSLFDGLLKSCEMRSGNHEQNGRSSAE